MERKRSDVNGCGERCVEVEERRRGLKMSRVKERAKESRVKGSVKRSRVNGMK
jgi:hypothetical protein